MARTFRTSRRRLRRGKREFIWVRVQGGFAALAGGGNAQEVALVTGATWGRAGPASGTVQKGCTLVRSRVSWMVYLTPDDAPASAVEGDEGFIGLRRADQDDTAVLNSGVDYLDEDWMHTDWWQVQRVVALVPTLAWSDANDARFARVWDSKVKRKLTTEDEIRLSACRSGPPAGYTPNGTFNVDFYAQFLLQLP